MSDEVGVLVFKGFPVAKIVFPVPFLFFEELFLFGVFRIPPDFVAGRGDVFLTNRVVAAFENDFVKSRVSAFWVGMVLSPGGPFLVKSASVFVSKFVIIVELMYWSMQFARLAASVRFLGVNNGGCDGSVIRFVDAGASVLGTELQVSV